MRTTKESAGKKADKKRVAPSNMGGKGKRGTTKLAEKNSRSACGDGRRRYLGREESR